MNILMKIELWILVIGVDHMNNNKYSQGILKFKKHGKIVIIVFVLFCFYIFIQKNPGGRALPQLSWQKKNLGKHVSEFIVGRLGGTVGHGATW